MFFPYLRITTDSSFSPDPSAARVSHSDGRPLEQVCAIAAGERVENEARARQCSSREADSGERTDRNRTPSRSSPNTTGTGKMNGGPSGFNNAPVTRSFVVASAIFTVFSGTQGRSHKLGLSYQDVYQKANFWKIVESAFSFSSTPELMFGLYMLYYFRVFERQIGSNKYSVFILFSSITSILCEVLALALLKDTSLKFTPGPYGLIFASFIPFYLDIPVSTKIRVFGVQFSDKSFIYLAGLQLLLSSWKRSIFPGICGFVAGSLYRLNLFYIRKAKFPEFISSFFARLSWPSIGRMPATSTRNVLGSMPSYAVRAVEPNYPAPAPSTQDPSEVSIATLVSMGFDQSSARQALIQARNDVNMATNILLESQSQ